MVRRIPADAWIALVLLAACGFVLNDLLATEGTGAFVKTTTLPTALVVVLALLALVLLAGALLRPDTPDGYRDDRPVDTQGHAGSWAGLLRVSFMVGWTALYIFGLPWLGFLAATMVFLIGASLAFGNRNPISVAAIAVFVPVALFLFFEKFMIVLLPASRLLG